MPISRRSFNIALATAALAASPFGVATSFAAKKPPAPPAPSREWNDKVLAAAVSHLGGSPSLVLTSDQIAAGTAWCSEFGSLVATESGGASLFTLGVPGSAINTSTNRWYNWASAHGKLVWSDTALKADGTAPNTLIRAGAATQPTPGDIVLEWHWKSTQAIWSTHTAIVESVSLDASGRPVYHTIDGNWSGTIKRRDVTTDERGKIFAIIRL